MSKGSRVLMLGTSIALGVGFLSVATAQSQMQDQQQPQQQTPQAQQPAQPQVQPPQSHEPQQAQPQDLEDMWQMYRQQAHARIEGAIQQLKTACQDELRNFCGNVTPGEGRLMLCMQAHDDKISRQCELALLDTARNIGKAVRNIERFAQACWPDIQVYCSGTNGSSVTQCVIDNRPSLSSACRATVAAMVPAPGTQGQPGQPKMGQGQQPPQAQQPSQAQQPQQGQQPSQAQQQPQGQHPSMVGLAIHSADGMMLGYVTGLKRRPDGSLEAVEAELGMPMGLGATSVLISPSDLKWKGDGVELQMAAEQVRNVLQSQRR